MLQYKGVTQQKPDSITEADKQKNMKLLIITSIKEYQQSVADILRKTGISVFSVSETTGFKNNDGEPLMNDWFGTGEGSFESVVLFSFTTEEKATITVNMLKEYNQKQAEHFPVRAFVLPVEQSSYQL